MRTLAQQDGSFLRRCESQSGSFVSFEQRYSDRQNKNSCGVVGRPPHHKRFTPVHVRLPLNTGDEIKAKERRNQIRPREGNILQMPAQREKKSCAASCLNVFQMQNVTIFQPTSFLISYHMRRPNLSIVICCHFPFLAFGRRHRFSFCWG